jgi:NAD dependent epimerase/dehydratase family.
MKILKKKSDNNSLGLRPLDRIFIAGHNGLVGSAVCRNLKAKGFEENLLLKDRKELDLINKEGVFSFLIKKGQVLLFCVLLELVEYTIIISILLIILWTILRCL